MNVNDIVISKQVRPKPVLFEMLTAIAQWAKMAIFMTKSQKLSNMVWVMSFFQFSIAVNRSSKKIKKKFKKKFEIYFRIFYLGHIDYLFSKEKCNQRNLKMFKKRK